MKVFNKFVENHTNELHKPELQLCIILLDLYDNSADGVIDTNAIKKHPLMNKSLLSLLYKVGDQLSGRKIINRHTWDCRLIETDKNVIEQKPEIVLFEKIDIGRLETKLHVNQDVWNSYKHWVEVDGKTMHDIKRIVNMRLYLWFKCWSEQMNTIRVSIDWLRYYLGVKVDNRALNHAYIREFVDKMKDIGINVTVENICGVKYTREITYIQFTVG